MLKYPVFRHSFKLLAAACLLLCLSACGMRPVRVAQEDHFMAMCARLRPEMIRRSLLDAQGNYLFHPLGVPEKGYGKILFQHLSPSFRYNADNPMTAPKTFAESAASADDVQMRDYGFTLRQGLDAVDVNLIAQSDWDGDGEKDWLLSCKVASGGAPISRTYYLSLPDLETEGIFSARTLAVFECISHDCKLHVPGRGKSSYIPESPVIESMPGQRAVTSPPANSPASSAAGAGNKTGWRRKRVP